MNHSSSRSAVTTKRAAPLLVWLALFTSVEPAFAQSSEERAEQLFRAGQARMQVGETREACALLSESQRLDPALGTLLNLAICHEKEGRIATAYREYAAASSWARDRGEGERDQFARGRVAELQKQVPRLRIEVAGVQRDLSVKVDGDLIERSELEADMPVDPGRHRIEVAAAGKKRWGPSEVRAEPGGMTVVHVVLDDEPKAITFAGYLTGGAGILSIGVGVALLLRASALDVESQREAEKAKMVSPPDPARKANALEYHDAAVTTQTVGLVSMGAGMLAVGASMYIMLSSRPAEPIPPSRAFHLVPNVGLSRAGLALEGRF